MTEYEYMFCMKIRNKLGEIIKGRIHVSITNNALVIKLNDPLHHINYADKIQNFYEQIVTDLNSDVICEKFCKNYSNYIYKNFFYGHPTVIKNGGRKEYVFGRKGATNINTEKFADSCIQ